MKASSVEERGFHLKAIHFEPSREVARFAFDERLYIRNSGI